MSSPISLQCLEDADGLSALRAALIQVAEDSLFAYAESCGMDRFAALLADRDPAEPWLSASIAFRGSFEGTAVVLLPHALAVGLCASFCGLPVQDLDDKQVADFAGELANMTCGLWLTHTQRFQRFDLGPPRVRSVSMPAPKDGAASVRSGVVIADVPLGLDLRPGAVPEGD